MLIRFQVSNFRSILGSAELSMIAVDRDREAARPAELLGESILTVSAIFGPNASGKSNVIAAFDWLREAVRDSLRSWDGEIPIDPFAFDDGPTRPSEFVVDSLVDGVRFEYVLELDRSAVHYEGLFHYPEKKRRRIFERDGSDLKLQRGLGGLSGTRELLTSVTLALSVAHRFNEPLVSKFVRNLIRAQVFGPQGFLLARIGGGLRPAGTLSTVRWFDEQPEGGKKDPGGDANEKATDRAQALALLRMADLGIVDVLVEDPVHFPMPPDGSEPPRPRPRRRVRLVHEAGDERAPLNFVAESEGTRAWFELIGPTLYALRSGTLIFFDELDASLHPTLSAQLIELFHDPATNPKGAQLIFTSHDTSLLNHLNRDEVWLTEKSRSGATRLGALADFAGERVRRSQNLENAYLHGRFGALPDTDRTELLRSLGLIG
ncbi:RloA protein [Frankia canadensis]|uniref:RloA protein n=1 Tax=Frankia canadensis TaxID=1836972 RepID=A0A2I2KUM4_9ACTN|nr:ATP-binding protein [Frankia canadensis]SNQ49365.1 RloA protein [Frankia canadensis]SOU56655.1 RloA protein [Frankia canadensis]